MVRQQCLSAEFFYPGCPNGCPGWVSTTTIGGRNHKKWRCLYCEIDFDTPKDSAWYGVDELPRDQRLVYIDCYIRGKSIREYAYAGPVDAVEARRLLKNAHRNLRGYGRDPDPLGKSNAAAD